jgi:surface antigen
MSGIQIFGDAYTWWKQAVGRYQEGFTPKAGAVLCFKPTERMRLGHVAVVSQVLTDRVIQITHANWSPIDGSRGKIEKDVTLIDVSQAGDWSMVKVWYGPNRDMGGSTYPTYGFIYQDAQAKLLASSGLSKAEDAAITMAQSAASQVAAAVRPGAGPMSILNQAADSTDRIAALIAAATRGDNPPAK